MKYINQQIPTTQANGGAITHRIKKSNIGIHEY